MTKLEILKAREPWQWPLDAAATLFDVLRDRHGDEERLLLATELAVDLPAPDEDVALALLEIVGDASLPERLRCAAATSLGPVLDDSDTEGYEEGSAAAVSEATFTSICDALHTVYRDDDAPKTLRRRALEASCSAPRPWHPAAVRAAYCSDDAQWRLTAVFCMRFIDGFHEEIVAALSDEDEDTLSEALLAAGNWGIPEAWSNVVALITNSSTERRVRLTAIEAAPTIDPAATIDLLAELVDEPDEELADTAAYAMLFAEDLLGSEDSFANDTFDAED